MTYLNFLFLASHLILRDTVNWTLSNYGIDLMGVEERLENTGLPLLVRWTLASWYGWNVALDKDLSVRLPRWPLDLEKWRRFRDLENPFDPILEIWSLGYYILSSFTETDSTIRLFTTPAVV